MTELQISSRAILAACTLNLELAPNGYACDSIELFAHVAEEMAAIVTAFPEMDTAAVVEFWQLHQDDGGRLAF